MLGFVSQRERALTLDSARNMPNRLGLDPEASITGGRSLDPLLRMCRSRNATVADTTVVSTVRSRLATSLRPVLDRGNTEAGPFDLFGEACARLWSVENH
jgi:hypothetical protein